MIIRSMNAEPARGADEQEQIVSGAVRPLNSEILIVLVIISAFVKLHNRYLSVCVKIQVIKVYPSSCDLRKEQFVNTQSEPLLPVRGT